MVSGGGSGEIEAGEERGAEAYHRQAQPWRRGEAVPTRPPWRDLGTASSSSQLLTGARGAPRGAATHASSASTAGARNHPERKNLDPMGKGSVIPGRARRIEEEGKVELVAARRLRPSTAAEVVGAGRKRPATVEVNGDREELGIERGERERRGFWLGRSDPSQELG